MAQPAHLVVVPVRTAPRMGPYVLPPNTEIEIPDTTRISRAALPRAGRWIVRALLIAIAIGGSLLAFGGEHKVKLDLEGTVRTVHTYATDAKALLDRNGTKFDREDLVAGDTLANEGSVTYRRAKQIRLVLDGEPKRVIAHGLTVGEAVRGLGLVPGPQDHMYPSAKTKLKPGLSIFVRNAIHAKLRVDGRLRDVVSSADTVSNLIAQAGVKVGPNDYVIPARQTEPSDGLWIRVVRVSRVIEERSVAVPYRYVTHRDPDLESGVRKVVQQGSEGLKRQRFSVVREDGVRVSNRLLGETVLRHARDHIVRVGTKEPTFKGGGGTQNGIASWFEADGLVAAHRSLPLGSVVKVTDVDTGKSVTVRINQRGPWVDGRVIDLSDDAFQRLAPLGQGTVKVKVQS